MTSSECQKPESEMRPTRRFLGAHLVPDCLQRSSEFVTSRIYDFVLKIKLVSDPSLYLLFISYKFVKGFVEIPFVLLVIYS